MFKNYLKQSTVISEVEELANALHKYKVIRFFYPFKVEDDLVVCHMVFFWWKSNYTDAETPKMGYEKMALNKAEIEDHIANFNKVMVFNCNLHPDVKMTAFKEMPLFRIPKNVSHLDFEQYFKSLSHTNWVRVNLLASKSLPMDIIRGAMIDNAWFLNNYEEFNQETHKAGRLVSFDNFTMMITVTDKLAPFQTLFQSTYNNEFKINYFDQNRKRSLYLPDNSFVVNPEQTKLVSYALGFPSLKEFFIYSSVDKASSSALEGNIKKWNANKLMESVSVEPLDLKNISSHDLITLISSSYPLFRSGVLEIRDGKLCYSEPQVLSSDKAEV